MDFFELSDQILLMYLLPKLDLEDLNIFCSIDPLFIELCQNDLLWQYKIFRDYPEDVDLRPNFNTWKDLYYYIYGVNIPLFYHDEIIDHVNVSPRDTIKTLREKIRNKLMFFVQTEKLVSFRFPEIQEKLKSEEVIPKVSYILVEDSNIDLLRLVSGRTSRLSIYYTMEELRQIAVNLGISPSGNKSDRVTRIKDVLIY